MARRSLASPTLTATCRVSLRLALRVAFKTARMCTNVLFLPRLGKKTFCSRGSAPHWLVACNPSLALLLHYARCYSHAAASRLLRSLLLSAVTVIAAVAAPVDAQTHSLSPCLLCCVPQHTTRPATIALSSRVKHVLTLPRLLSLACFVFICTSAGAGDRVCPSE
jgi:hypothetical protein